MDFLPWEHDEDDRGLAYITDLPESVDDDSFQILEEESIASWWPEEVLLDLSLDKGIKVSDNIANAVGVHIVSEKLKQILAEECGETIDFYPVKIRNQKGRLIKKPYYLAHLRLIIGAMAWDKSDFDINDIHPERAATIRRLVLDEKKYQKKIRGHPRSIGNILHQNKHFSHALRNTALFFILKHTTFSPFAFVFKLSKPF